MLRIDGSIGEGGGQVLRTCLALSLCRNEPFQLINIRAKRRKTGLCPQHLTAVLAAAEISQAETIGAELSSTNLTFMPQGVAPGNYHFSMATAGSTTLVLQAVLPVLLSAAGPSRLTLEGGTHNPMAPPFDFLVHTFLPVIAGMGAKVSARLLRPGFYPAGGGKIQVTIEPIERLNPLELTARDSTSCKKAVAVISHLPEHIAQRELAVIGRELGLAENCLEIRDETRAKGAGNVVYAMVEGTNITEVFTGFGRRGVTAEVVAKEVVQEVSRYLGAAGAVVGRHLADQLLVPLILAGEGAFTTLTPSLHTLTNMEVIRHFTGHRFSCQQKASDLYQVKLER